MPMPMPPGKPMPPGRPAMPGGRTVGSVGDTCVAIAACACLYATPFCTRSGRSATIIPLSLTASSASATVAYSMMSIAASPSPASLMSRILPAMEKRCWYCACATAGLRLVAYTVRICGSFCTAALSMACFAAAAIAAAAGVGELPGPSSPPAPPASGSGSAAGSPGLPKNTGNGEPEIGNPLSSTASHIDGDGAAHSHGAARGRDAHAQVVAALAQPPPPVVMHMHVQSDRQASARATVARPRHLAPDRIRGADLIRRRRVRP
eukprot:222575-Chlamydomonas_euryale.AAC.6